MLLVLNTALPNTWAEQIVCTGLDKNVSELCAQRLSKKTAVQELLFVYLFGLRAGICS